ncbi:MAG: MerR family transcriptional regulator [Actinomycetota bacterium]|nr:MerR family transcriptional regulator [Actinomycetota bacterium]
MPDQINGDRGVYSIAVAAELAGLGEQTLRLYERKGLLTPARTSGGTRRYSDNDVVVLRRVVELVAEGLNLTGARRVLELELLNGQLQTQIAKLNTTLASR